MAVCRTVVLAMVCMVASACGICVCGAVAKATVVEGTGQDIPDTRKDVKHEAQLSEAVSQSYHQHAGNRKKDNDLVLYSVFNMHSA